jgi:hypothetical protein
MAQAVSRQPFISEARVRSQASRREICVGQVFLRVHQSPSVSFIPLVLYTYLHLPVALPKGQIGTFQTAMLCASADPTLCLAHDQHSIH